MSELITSKDNKYLKRLRLLSADAKARRESGEFVAEGGTMLGEAVRRGAEITSVLLPDGEPVPDILTDGTQVYFAARRLFDGVSSVETPRNVIFTCKASAPEPDPAGICLILDRVADPGNIGTILRTADAFGAGVFLTPGCADMWSPKVVRATMGACFRVPRAATDGKIAVERLRAAGKRVYAAVLSDRAADVRTIDAADAAFVIGNEAHGVSDELRAACDGDVIIPMTGAAESLNAAVAASILLWECARSK